MDIDSLVIKECKRRRLSPITIQTYLYCIRKFLNYSKRDLKYTSKKDAREFLEMLSEKGVAGSTLNVYHMAIRFLLEDILNKNIRLNIHYSKTPKRLPSVLTKEEVRKLLNAISNWKHRLMIEFLYGSGLRVSELINMKVQDLNLEKNYGFVRNGKGGKDRIIVIPKIVIEKVRNLIEIENLNEKSFVFVSNRGRKYSIRSIQKIIKNASKKTGLENWKEIHPHTLRHSFVTQLISNGYDVSYVQGILGHKSPETSMIYVHMAAQKLINIKSPLDSLQYEILKTFDEGKEKIFTC